MKIKVAYKITSLALAFLMLSTSAAFSIDIHYCKGEFKSFSFIGEAKTCHEAKKVCPHHVQKSPQNVGKNSCCSNKTHNVDELDVDFNIAIDDQLSDSQLKLVISFAYTFFDLSTPKIEKSTFPKAIVQIAPRDIYVLLDRFLI